MATQLSIAYQQLLNDRRKTQEQIRSDKMNERINLQRNALDYRSKIYAADSSNEASKYGSFMGYAGKVYSADQSYKAAVQSADKSLQSAIISAKGRTDSAQISAAASRYGADRSYAASKYKADIEAATSKEIKALDREVSWYNAYTQRAETQSNIRKNAAQTNLFSEQARQTSYITDNKLPEEVSKTKAETLNTQARTRSTDAATFTGLLPNATYAARVSSDAAKLAYLTKEFGDVYSSGPESAKDIKSLPDVINATTDYWLGDGRNGHNIISDTKSIGGAIAKQSGRLVNAVGNAIDSALNKPHLSDTIKDMTSKVPEHLRESAYQAWKNNVLSGYWYPPEAYGDSSFVERFYKEVPNYGKKK